MQHDHQGDSSRIRHLEKRREAESHAFQNSLEKMKSSSNVTWRPISDKFAIASHSIENQLKQETIGLETLDSFRRKREDLTLEGPAIPLDAPIRKKDRSIRSKLSFEDVESTNGELSALPPPKRLFKDPTVNTSFLPDHRRDEKERQERLQLKKEWLAAQEKIKAEKINITYSYYDGAGHRRNLVINKGSTVESFLSLVRREFKELRNVSTDNLMFIKEDLIIPPNYSFYELIETKARGKSGPLFYWDVHDDIRYTSDASVEKEESHAAKVVEKRWYDSNKHTFPMNRWEVFDLAKNNHMSKYTIKDNAK